MHVELIKTYIPGLDEVLGGGLPRPGVVYLVGHTGTGKTTLCAQILYERAKKHSEKGLYICTSEHPSLLISRLKSMGIDFEKLVENNLIEVAYGTPISEENIVATLLEEVLAKVETGEFSNIALDSITSLVNFIPVVKVRGILGSLYKHIIDKKLLGILVGEISLTGKSPTVGVEEFMCDTIIKLEQYERAEGYTLRLTVLKNRVAGHSRAYYEISITDKGFEVLAPFKP
ncbi:MAG: hypothetical protein DRN04_03710 [Thermoprotei archaeon]|nr:MAG: hypothetical protein DRN04_03710 [Thermoprotei archaeon]